MTKDRAEDRARAVAAGWPGRPGLHIAAPLAKGAEGAAFRVADPSGGTFVLKIGHRDRIAGEKAALEALAGPALVELVDWWGSEGALLLEDIVPGRQLLRQPDEDLARSVLHAVMAGLARPCARAGFPALGDWLQALGSFEGELRAAGDPRLRMVAEARVLSGRLLATAPPPRLLHGDLHDQNMLSRSDGAYTAIDPKGIAGDPAYEPACFLMNRWERRPRATVAEMTREARLTAEGADLPAQRVWDWTLVHTALSLAWSVEDGGMVPGAEEPRWRILDRMMGR